MREMPKIILDELEKIDRSRWAVESGAGHAKLKIDGKLVGVFSRSGNGKRESYTRDSMNVRSQIRRHVNAGKLDRAL
jgi:hypothetical protein